jgi:hypothetical protein
MLLQLSNNHYSYILEFKTIKLETQDSMNSSTLHTFWLVDVTITKFKQVLAVVENIVESWFSFR